MNIGSQYSYSSDDQSEFLVVVSKDFDPRVPSSKQTDKEKVEQCCHVKVQFSVKGHQQAILSVWQRVVTRSL